MRRRRARTSLCLVALACLAAGPRVDLSDDGRSVVVEVSDDAPQAIDVVGDAIVPIAWRRDGRSRATLPLILLPGAGESVALDVAGTRVELKPTDATPRVWIDRRLYATPVAAPPPDRRRTLGAAATATLALLLATRLRRPRDAIAAMAGVTTFGALAIALAARRPDVARVERDGVAWLIARRATTVELPPDSPPIAESAAHLRMLAPRLHVSANRATLALALPAGGRVAIAEYSVRPTE